MIPRALTIAGSDSSGGAGIQADLKTFAALGVYGMSAITAVTSQNTLGVTDVFHVPADVVASQIDAVMADIPTETVKTGMLSTAANVEVVAEKVREYRIQTVVVDPITASSSGTSLLRGDGIAALRESLLPLAFLVSPNLDEAGALVEGHVRDVFDMEEAARAVYEMGPRYVIVKGGHLEEGPAVDVVFDGETMLRLSEERVRTTDTHGTGCVLSAAITANLARGMGALEAVRAGKEFLTRALANSLRMGGGSGPCDPTGLGV